MARMATWFTWLHAAAALGLVLGIARPSESRAADVAATREQPAFIDNSLMVGSEFPGTWPNGFPPFVMNHYLRIGPTSPYNSDVIFIDENTGTQFDAPTHSVAPPDSKLPNAGPFGVVAGDNVPAYQFGGEACVIDCRSMLESGPLGRSDLITKAHVRAWEARHSRPLRFGDVVLFHSGYSDRFYKPLPEGRRFVADPVQGTAPGWPDPDPDCMEYIATRKAMAAGTDSPSMGPIPGPIAEATHFAGLKYGMIWTEGATGLDKLPTTGAFYCMLAPKFVGGIGGSGRGFAIVGGELPKRLIDSVRKKSAVDLSVSITEQMPVWWPGPGVGNSRYPYLRNLIPPFYQARHSLDSHAGTHLVPPSYSLPRSGFDNSTYSPEVREWLAEFEKRYGPRGHSDVTTEKVPLEQTCGEARIIDVRSLANTTNSKQWPASPEITPAHIEAYERSHGELKGGDIVIFLTGHSDRHCKPFPLGNACLADPLNGKSEGWPAPGPDAIAHLAKRGIRCIATDGPTLGGVDPKRALMTYWLMGTKGLVGVEYLTNVSQLPPKSYFLFAAIKIRGCHGGPGRAIAFF